MAKYQVWCEGEICGEENELGAALEAAFESSKGRGAPATVEDGEADHRVILGTVTANKR